MIHVSEISMVNMLSQANDFFLSYMVYNYCFLQYQMFILGVLFLLKMKLDKARSVCSNILEFNNAF